MKVNSLQLLKVPTPLSIWRGVGGEAFLFGLFLLFFTSCSSETEDYDPYYNWQARNAIWYSEIADSARTAIAQARSQYGDAWEEHCDWRMLKSFQLSETYQSGVTEDSICVRILAHGKESLCPIYTDSVRISFRGWLMPTKNEDNQTEEFCFTTTYYGDYSSDNSAPQLAAVASFADGFSTALQYMVEGDDWMVYIPQQLFYGSTAKDVIPAYSTVRFRIQMVAVYPSGTTIPAWK